MMRENARQNLELSGGGLGGPGGMGGPGQFVPRTSRVCHDAIPKVVQPKEFAAELIAKLEKVKRERESQEKVQQSFKRIQEVRLRSLIH